MQRISDTIRALTACGLAAALSLAQPAAAQAAKTAGVVRDAGDIVYPPMPSVERPAPQRVVLDNGMVVMLLEDHELPLIEARAQIRTGSRREPADHVGLAGLAGEVLRSGGTEAMSSDELDDLLEDRAAVLETSSGTTSGSAFMSCLKDDFGEMLGLLADVLRRPAFEEDKLAVAKTQVEAGIARQNDNANQILQREFQELIYGSDSPYARTPTYDSVGNVDRDDLVAWHRRYYHPERIILGLVGDFDAEAALAEVEKAFGDWPRGPAVDEPEIAVETPSPGVFFVEKNDVNQSYIRLGHLGLRRDHPDYYAIEVMNQVLGGSFAARLFSRVRSQKGLAYNVSGAVQTDWDHPGLFFMSMGTKVETTAAGIDALLEEARNMTAEPPTEEEVAKAKEGILNSFVFLADSTGEILQRQLTCEYYGYPLDWLDRYRAGIEGVTTAQVRAAAAAHIHPERLAILVVGPAEGTDRPLSDFGEVQAVDVTIPEPAAPEVEVTEEGKAKARELIARAVEGIGGAERLDGLRSTEMTASVALTTPQGEMSAGARTIVVFPDRVRSELSLPMGSMVQVIAGESGFLQMGPQSRPMPEAQLQEGRRSLVRNAVGLLAARDRDGFEAVAAGADEVGGTSVELVRVEIDGYAMTAGIDPATGRILRLGYRGSVMGPPGDVLQLYSDFREVDGLTLPFASVTTVDGNPAMSTTVQSISLDGEYQDSLFEMPVEGGS
jgi:predicted Zn-dependent peptidase